MLNIAFESNNPREELQSLVNKYYTKSIKIADLEQWPGGVKPPKMKYFKVFAQILKVKRVKEEQKTIAVRNRREGTELSRAIKCDTDTRMVTFRYILWINHVSYVFSSHFILKLIITQIAYSL
jgi:hypothetical protein